MKKADRDRWVEALRSGRYRQTTGVLRSLGGKFCCLGVAADVLIPEPWEHDPARTLGYTFEGNDDPHVLLAATRGRIGLKREDHDTLAGLNDNRGWSFKQIADWIESNVKVD
jgi:hypothetical protein